MGSDLGGGWMDFQAQAAARISADGASFGRRLRADGEHSWRGVARPTASALGTSWESNQAAGMILSEAAARCLGEDPNTAPWN